MMELSHKRFDEVFDLQLGRTPARGVDKYWGGTNTWVSIADMGQTKYISSSKEGISGIALVETGIPLVPKDVVIMSFKLSIGKVAITKRELYTNEAIMAFIPKPETKILNDYLYYYLQGYKWDNSNNVVMGFTLNKKSISTSVISYPSLPEQQRIVDILDQEFAKIDALKANAEKSLQAAKDLFQATLKKELEPKEGWEMKRITELASLKAGKFVSAQDIFDERGKGLYPCFGGNGLRGYVKTYNHEGRFNIIGRQGALCGNINIADGKFHATEHAVVVSPIVPVIFKFLYYSLCNANINQYATGAAQPGISVKNINERLFLAIPSLVEQKRVADQLDQIKQQTDTLQDNYQKTLSLCDDLKQSLLRKAFNGEL